MNWGEKRVCALEGIVRAVACSHASEAIARAVFGAGNIMREIAQNVAPRYIFAARVKIASLLDEYTGCAGGKKAVIIARRILAPLLEMLLPF
jgi:hypothetical protein